MELGQNEEVFIKGSKMTDSMKAVLKIPSSVRHLKEKNSGHPLRARELYFQNASPESQTYHLNNIVAFPRLQ